MRRTVAAMLGVFVVLLVAVACGGTDDGAVSEPPPTAELEETAPGPPAPPEPEPPPEATPEAEPGAELFLADAEESVLNAGHEMVFIDTSCFNGEDGPAKTDARDAARERLLEKARVYDDAERALAVPLGEVNEALEEVEASEQQFERFLETVDDPDQLSPEDFATANELRDKYEKSHEAAEELKAIARPLRDQWIETGEALDAAQVEYNRVNNLVKAVFEKCER
jgi:hypothetical protein